MVKQYTFRRGEDEIEVFGDTPEFAREVAEEEWESAFDERLPADVEVIEGESLPSFEEFESKYTLVQNHIDEDASYDGSMFETYGDEDAYIREMATTHPNRVWTILDGESNSLCLVAGWHYVNRQGYLITEEPWTNPAEEYVI